MKISENKFVSLTYTLTVDRQIADQATAERPLNFVYGVGMLLPKFEEYIAGKAAGDTFEFVLSPAEGYGETNPQAVVNLPKEVFMVDGAIPDDMLVVGNVLPMADQNGNRLMGTVKAVNDTDVTMDFNHPMAGKTLNFSGQILEVRDARPEDMMPAGGGCSCGCEGDCGDGGCGDGCGESGCGCH